MITDEEFESNSIANFVIKNREEISLIDSIKIDNNLFGRFDIIMNRYYPDNMKYMWLILDFNHISDPFNLNIGQIIELPNLADLKENTVINDIMSLDDDSINEVEIPGVNNSTNSKIINTETADTNGSTQVTAIPVLSITKNEVSYDKDSGTVTI